MGDAGTRRKPQDSEDYGQPQAEQIKNYGATRRLTHLETSGKSRSTGG